MPAQPQTVIAFDYGTRHIGVAVGQTVTRTASPLSTIGFVKSRPDWNAISQLIDTWKPDALVVGEPLNMDGTEQEMTRLARRFANQLRGRFSLSVEMTDERLSSREARERVGPSLRNWDDHGVAAQVILETWLATAEVVV